jgi:hypothetical protein
MPTTTKMGIVYPSSTDLVKDGATAMGTISTTVDSKTGMVLLNTTTLTSTTSQSLNSIFSSSFDNYKIVITGLSSAGGSLIMRLRASGTDNSTASSYVRQIIDGTGGTVSGNRSTSNSWDMAGVSASLVNAYFIDLVNPFKASATGYVCSTIRADSGGYYNPSTGTHNQTVSYDGFTILPSSAFTGEMNVYGYNR